MIKHVNIVHISLTVLYVSIHSSWLVCLLTVFKLTFPLPYYFSCNLFIEEIRSFVLQFPQVQVGHNFTTSARHMQPGLPSLIYHSAPRTLRSGNTELPKVPGTYHAVRHFCARAMAPLFPPNTLLAHSALYSEDSGKIISCSPLSHTYPPQLAPLVPRCMRGSLEASLISSFHSFCHSSSVYTSPDCVKDRHWISSN